MAPGAGHAAAFAGNGVGPAPPGAGAGATLDGAGAATFGDAARPSPRACSGDGCVAASIATMRGGNPGLDAEAAGVDAGARTAAMEAAVGRSAPVPYVEARRD